MEIASELPKECYSNSTGNSLGWCVPIVGGYSVMIFATRRICSYLKGMNGNFGAALAIGDGPETDEVVDEDPASVILREKGLLAFRGIHQGRDYNIANESRSTLHARVRRSVAYMAALVEELKNDESDEN